MKRKQPLALTWETAFPKQVSKRFNFAIHTCGSGQDETYCSGSQLLKNCIQILELILSMNLHDCF